MNTVFLHKLLALLFSPLAFILLLLLIGLLRRSVSSIVAALIILWVAATPLVGSSLWRFLERDFQHITLDEVVRADAIVVLSGALSFSNSKGRLIQEWGDPDRFFGGMDLFKANKARYLVFTGGKLPWSIYPPEGLIFRERAINSGVNPTSIIVTRDVANTAQEAKAVGQIATELGFQSIILVTSSYHMHRALGLFEKEVAEVFPYPVDFFPTGHGLTAFELIPSASSFSHTSYALRELLGRAYYSWML